MDTTIDRSALEQKLIPELQRIAQDMGIEGTQRLRKAGLIDAIVAQSGNGSGEDGSSAGSSEPRNPSTLRRAASSNGSAASSSGRASNSSTSGGAISSARNGKPARCPMAMRCLTDAASTRCAADAACRNGPSS